MSLSRVLLVSLTERDLCFNIQPSDCICLKKYKNFVSVWGWWGVNGMPNGFVLDKLLGKEQAETG